MHKPDIGEPMLDWPFSMVSMASTLFSMEHPLLDEDVAGEALILDVLRARTSSMANPEAPRVRDTENICLQLLWGSTLTARPPNGVKGSSSSSTAGAGLSSSTILVVCVFLVMNL